MTMVMTMRKPETAAVVPSVAEAQAAATAAEAEVARLEALDRGTVERWEPRTERRVFVTATGAADEREITTSVLVTRTVPLGERYAAKLALPQARLRALEAGAALEAAKEAASVAARVQRTEAIAAGNLVVRSALPGLIAEVRKVQERFAVFHEEIARLDAAVGGEYFQLQAAAPMFMPGQVLDAWCAAVAQAFPVERR